MSKESGPKDAIVNGVTKVCCEDQANCPTMPDRWYDIPGWYACKK